jgi:hypothetical protein
MVLHHSQGWSGDLKDPTSGHFTFLLQIFFMYQIFRGVTALLAVTRQHTDVSEGGYLNANSIHTHGLRPQPENRLCIESDHVLIKQNRYWISEENLEMCW